MKALKYILILTGCGLLLIGVSCSDFLDTTPSTSVIDNEVFITTAGAQTALNGSYYQMRARGSSGRDSDDDYGLPSVLLYSDMSGEDVIADGGWYNWVYTYWGETRADIFRSQQFWVFHYRLINNVNSIIAYVDETEGPDIDKQHIKGQALAIRGWAYFNLIRLFQQTYIIAKDMPGVSLYLEPTTEKTVGKPRGTVEQTYSRILSDLTEAEKLLEGFNRGNRTNNFDQSVVRGVLAQVYQVMNEWPKCEEYAKKLLDQYPLTTNEQYQAGFNDDTTPSWIWGMKQTEEQNMSDFSLFAMWANDTRKCYSFRAYYAADDFVALFDKEDARWQFEAWKGKKENTYIYASFKFRDNDNCRGSIVFMRSDEMLLNAAEALARQGKEGEAKEMLWQLQDLRNSKRSQSSGASLIEDILIERRKELYGEGHSLFDITRNQKPLLRTGNHTDYGGGQSFPALSWRFIFQIPDNEIKNNDSLVDGTWPNGDQNPYDGTYQP